MDIELGVTHCEKCWKPLKKGETRLCHSCKENTIMMQDEIKKTIYEMFIPSGIKIYCEDLTINALGDITFGDGCLEFHMKPSECRQIGHALIGIADRIEDEDEDEE